MAHSTPWQKRIPGRIKVRLTIDGMGGLMVVAISARVREAVAESNAYDHSAEVYIQCASIPEHACFFPPAAVFKDSNGVTRWNSGARFLMDSWEYRQRVGGQSD